MKTILLILGILACIAATKMMAQTAQGVITYEVKRNMHRNLPEGQQEMKTMMPEWCANKCNACAPMVAT